MFDMDDEALVAFLEESREHLATIEHELLVLEARAGAPDTSTINAIFRAAHSIKGTAGFFALDAVKDLAHAMENVLGRIRACELLASPGVVSVLLSANTLLSQMISDLAGSAQVDASGVLAQLHELESDGGLAMGVIPMSLSPESPGPPPSSNKGVEVRRPDGSIAFVLDAERLDEARGQTLGGPFVHWLDVPDAAIGELEKMAVVLDRRPRDEHAIEVACVTTLSRDRLADLLGLGAERVHPRETALVAPAPAAEGTLRTQIPPAFDSQQLTLAVKPTEAANTIRVNVAQLDRLMALAGELVLTRNALLKKASERSLEEMIELSQRVDAITSELQDGIMATRMQPVGIVFTKFRRIVRDLGHSLHKQLELEIEGEEVELDKTIIEAIGDPLSHLVRNAADHGIESPEARRQAGKSERGRLRLRAFHEAGQVVIEVSDDGRGIDPERVGQKAIQNGMLTREQLDAMREEEIIRLIFEPGFSTAAQVTEVSGRGVGMDVVQSSIAKVGGAIDIRSTVGAGSTITVRLPLTLAIIPSLLVASGGERFAIPQVNLLELTRIKASEADRIIERVGSASVMRLRGELLPLLRLSAVLGCDVAEPTKRAAINVVVLAAGPLRFGLVVDQLLDSEEIVVKPLGSHLSGCREYAGATILGDGTVALILDVAGIAATTGLSATKSMLDALAPKPKATSRSDVQTYLLVENAPGEVFGVPLALVSRIERLVATSVSTAGGRRTVCHGNLILPLVALEDAAQVGPRPPSRLMHAVVCRVFGREVGVLAARILDVVESDAPVDAATHAQPGILGSTIVDGQLVLLVDVHGLVSATVPELRAAPRMPADRPTVLVVEDSPFFRKQLVSCLQESGYQTIAAEDGRQGLEELESHADDVRLIITDIEMPRMDGLEMTRKIRQQAQFGALPIFAVTSLSGESEERKGREAGLNEWLVKFDREQILDRTRFHLENAQKRNGGAPYLQQGV